MLSFKGFISESTMPEEGSKLKHIKHPEDRVFDGEKGFEHAHAALTHAHDYIKSGGHGTALTMKYDGSPSIVYGHHPETGKFFVASKSAFNKTPKINYSHSDVDENHGNTPELADKLKSALDHLPKIAPKTGVYQGDLMFSKDDDKKHNDDGSVSFTPNTLTYSGRGGEADKLKKAKLGIITHTQYHGDTLSSMKSDPHLNHTDFNSNPDVWNKTPEHDTKQVYYSSADQKSFKRHLATAKNLHDAHKGTMYPVISVHGGDNGHLSTYINQTVRTGETPSDRGLITHIADKYGKIISKLKTKPSKDRRYKELQDHISYIANNADQYNNLFKTHNHLQKAKNILIKTLNQHEGGLEQHISDKRTDPEGFIIHHEDQPTKLVNRAEFSKANLLKVR